jgi:hypothetical protein
MSTFTLPAPNPTIERVGRFKVGAILYEVLPTACNRDVFPDGRRYLHVDGFNHRAAFLSEVASPTNPVAPFLFNGKPVPVTEIVSHEYLTRYSIHPGKVGRWKSWSDSHDRPNRSLTFRTVRGGRGGRWCVEVTEGNGPAAKRREVFLRTPQLLEAIRVNCLFPVE